MQIQIQGVAVDISHLKPIVREMTLDLRGGFQKKNAQLHFRFSCHCYSKRPADAGLIPADMLVLDGSARAPRNRIFSWERYRNSLSLVQHLDTLICTNGLVHVTRHLNFFATSVVTTTESGLSIEMPYYVFMAPTKQQAINQPPRLDIFVESAYTGEPNIPGPVMNGGPVPLSKMLGSVWVDGKLR